MATVRINFMGCTIDEDLAGRIGDALASFTSGLPMESFTETGGDGEFAQDVFVPALTNLAKRLVDGMDVGTEPVFLVGVGRSCGCSWDGTESVTHIIPETFGTVEAAIAEAQEWAEDRWSIGIVIFRFAPEYFN